MIKIQNTRNENSLYNAVEFVVRATKKDDVKEFMRYVYRDKEFLVASDGHRLHMALLDNVMEKERQAWLTEDGAYEVISKNRKEVIIHKVENAPEFPPNWQKYMRIKDFEFTETMAGGSYFGIDKALCDTIRLCPDYQHFNIDYLKDVFKSGYSESWTVLMGGDLQPCLIKNCFKAAAVMPIKT